MPSELAHAIAAYIGYAVCTFLLLRLVAAPYFIWKEDQNKIKSMEEKILLPDKRAKEQILEAITQRRIELVDHVNEVTFDVFAGHLPPKKLLKTVPFQMKLFSFLQASDQANDIRQWWLIYLSKASEYRVKAGEFYSGASQDEILYNEHKEVAAHWQKYLIKSILLDDFDFEESKNEASEIKLKYKNIKT